MRERALHNRPAFFDRIQPQVEMRFNLLQRADDHLEVNVAHADRAYEWF
jgi:hypothetical protein